MAKTVAQDGEGLHKRPALLVQLGGGNNHLSQKGLLEGGEGEAQAKSSKKSGVDKAKEALRVRCLVKTHRLTYPTGHNPHIFIVVLAEDTRLMTSLFLHISSYARKGSKTGSFL